MLKNILKRTYVYFILALFFIPMLVGAIYSFSKSGGRADMPISFSPSTDGWNQLSNNDDIAMGILNSVFLALFVSLLVVAISLLTVFGLWRQKNRASRAFVVSTSNIPLINPDVITAISLAFVFGAIMGTMSVNDTGYERLLLAQTTMILPFAITIMYPRSEKFKISLMEASKDLGYGSIKTWFKTYFRHMIPVALASFAIAYIMSLDDFIITRIVSKETTIGKLMYQGTLKPWVLALGTILMGITLASTAIFAVVIARREKRLRKVKR